MSDFKVIDRSTGEEVTRYSAAAPTEASGYSLTAYEHVPYLPDSPPTTYSPLPWRIDVGAFFDRFGPMAKIAILSDIDPQVQAVIKDVSVRKYIDLTNRRGDLLMGLSLIASKGHVIDPVAILDTPPTSDEVWNG